MFFILSKLLLIFIFPFTWILFALIVYAYHQKAAVKKYALGIAIGVFLIFTNPILLNLFANYWNVDTKTQGKYSAAILLGGFVSVNNKKEGYFNNASDRFLQAALLKTRKQVDYIVITGGSGSLIPGKFKESIWARKQFNDLGIAPRYVITENDSRNTLENALFTRRILDSLHLKGPYLLVTSSFHMRRSLLTFSKAGLDVLPYASHPVAGNQKLGFDSFIPDLYVMLTWNVYIKELIGCMAYAFKMK